MPSSSLQRDSLTGLLTRQAFQEELVSHLTKARETNEPLSLALLDLDNFLKINENLGHAAGDNILKMVAETIRAQLTQNALAVRFGGDEFALLLPGCEREQAFLILESIRNVIENARPLEGNDCLPRIKDDAIVAITLSGGLASFPVDGRTESELMRKADQALYRAKALGRNRIRLAFEERMVPKTSHFPQTQLERLSALAGERSTGEAELLREALDDLLSKYGVTDIEN